jgi:hypothetical protein
MLTLAETRMADGAASLAIILSHLWQDAGNPQSGATVFIDVPAWVAPQYPMQMQLAKAPMCSMTPADCD